MSNIYEKIGRKAVAMLATAEFAKVADKGIGGKKNKCQPQNISCGKSCISGKKTCRISMTMAQQRAAKELKKELRSTKSKIEPKVEPNTMKPVKKDLSAETKKTWEAEITKQLEYFRTRTSNETGLAKAVLDADSAYKIDAILSTKTQLDNLGILSREMIEKRSESVFSILKPRRSTELKDRLTELQVKHIVELQDKWVEANKQHQKNAEAQAKIIDQANAMDESIRPTRNKDNYDLITDQIKELDNQRHQARVSRADSESLANKAKDELDRYSKKYGA